MASSYQKKSCAAVIFALVIFGLMIACLTTSWYFWSITWSQKTGSSSSTLNSVSTTVLNYTKITYGLDGYRTDTQVSGSTAVNSVYTQISRTATPNSFSIFKLSQAFVLIALILSFNIAALLVVFLMDPIRNKVIFALGMSVTRFILIVASLLVVASTAISFLGFLGITAGFKKDYDSCTEGPCRAFSSSTTSQFDASSTTPTTSVNEWGPDAGWYIALSSVPISILLLAVVVINKFPLPIDSEASSGEAL